MPSNSKKKRSRSNNRPHTRSLSHGRPLKLAKDSAGASLPSHKTRAIIRSHHQLSKSLSQAIAAGDERLIAQIEAQIEDNGGLKTYQAASIAGQSTPRGGDTSIKLLVFLQPFKPLLRQQQQQQQQGLAISLKRKEQVRFRILDVGALSTNNAISRRGKELFDVTSIDLNSQESRIEQQDFMERPFPRDDIDKFDIVCLSLVLNYVPDARARGQMLKRVPAFLRSEHSNLEEGPKLPLPGLFLVLPAACVTNSRYLTSDLLTRILGSLDFTLVQSQVSAKLVYSLWRWHGTAKRDHQNFAKVEVNPGKVRNNFAIILD